MLQFILLGSGAGQRRKNGKRSPAPTFPILQIGWLLQLDSLHIHWASLRLKLVVLSCAVCGCSFGKPSEAHARNGDFSGCRGSAKGLGLNCRGFPPKARRRSADRRQATFKFIYASGGRGRGGGDFDIRLPWCIGVVRAVVSHCGRVVWWRGGLCFEVPSRMAGALPSLLLCLRSVRRTGRCGPLQGVLESLAGGQETKRTSRATSYASPFALLIQFLVSCPAGAERLGLLF